MKKLGNYNKNVKYDKLHLIAKVILKYDKFTLYMIKIVQKIKNAKCNTIIWWNNRISPFPSHSGIN